MKGISPIKWQIYHVDVAGVTVCAILALLGYVVGIKPLVQRRVGLAAQETRLNVQKRDAEKLADSAASLKRKLASVKRALAESPLQLESTDSINNRISRVAGLAAECGMKIDEIQPGQWAASLRYKTVPIRLVAGGKFPACVALLHRLRVAFPDTAVASFELTGHPRTPATPAKFEVNLVWYTTASHRTSRTYERNPAEFASVGPISSN